MRATELISILAQMVERYGNFDVQIKGRNGPAKVCLLDVCTIDEKIYLLDHKPIGFVDGIKIDELLEEGLISEEIAYWIKIKAQEDSE
jgi:hypothetical protein